MKPGDLVIRSMRNVPEDNLFKDAWWGGCGIIIKWVRTGGPKGTVWEVLYPEGTEYWDENDLEVISEAR